VGNSGNPKRVASAALFGSGGHKLTVQKSVC
jgi:hypothetical protein